MNVRHMLDTYPCLQLVPAEPRLAGPGLTGPEDRQAMAAVVAALAMAPAPSAVAVPAAVGHPESAAPDSTPGNVAGQAGAAVGRADAAPAATIPGSTVEADESSEAGAAAVAVTASETPAGHAGRFNPAECCQQWLSEQEAGMVQRFDPSGPADTIGFFIAKFHKTCSCQVTTGG